MKIRRFQPGQELALFEIFYSAIHLIARNDYSEEQLNVWAALDLDRELLVMSSRMWLLVVEEKGRRIDIEMALPQLLAYMMAAPSLKFPLFGLATSGNAFVKVQARSHDRSICDYAISDTLVIRSRSRQLATVLQVLKRVKLMLQPRM
jgi:hypothetical protein